MSDRQQQSKACRVPSPSPELASLLALVNEIPDTAGVAGPMSREPLAPGSSWETRFESAVSELPSSLLHYIGPLREAGESCIGYDAPRRYNELVRARAILLFAAQQNASAMRFVPPFVLDPGNPGMPMVLFEELTRSRSLGEHRASNRHRLTLVAYWRAFPLTMVDLVDAGLWAEWRVVKNKLKIVTIPRIEALADIDYLRIRECSRCGAIFFAGRLQQVACPEPCAHILRTLRWREAYPVKYKAQRIRKADARDAFSDAPRQERKSPKKERE